MKGRSLPKFACPRCDSYRSVVVNSRPNIRTDGVRRRRRCLDCRHRFTTEEVLITTRPSGPLPKNYNI